MSFLSSLLPAALGAGAVAVMGPAALPWVAGGLGAYQTMRTGSLEKGLMAGLGAYGGGSMAGGLSALGSSEAGLTSGAEALGTTKDAFVANPDQFFLSQSPANTAGLDAFGNAPGAAGYDMATSGVMVDPAKQEAFRTAYEKAAQPSLENVGRGLSITTNDPSKYVGALGGGWDTAKVGLAAAAPALVQTPEYALPSQSSSAQIAPRYRYNPGVASPLPSPSARGVEQSYFPGQGYAQITNDQAKQLYGFADGGDVQGDPNLMQVKTFDPVVRMARGGISDLGGYSDGGRLLRGPGDGVSDSIPAMIGKKQPARLADGEFVVPARIVSELGNGSTEAGARQLYAMMDRVQKARGKTVGKGKVAKRTNPNKLLPA